MRREDVVQVWVELADEEPPRREARRPGPRSRRPWGHVALAGVALAVLAAPFGVAATGDALREGVRNGTTNRETEIIGDFNATTSGKGGYVTRQSNTQTGPRAGGGAIYGCRGAAGGTAAGSAPCLRASNLANGYAFELASNSGPAGLFEVGSPSDPPFATDGRGRVENLNADMVDGLDSGAFLRTSGKAADADSLDGLDSGAFLRTSGKAADADSLDGLDSGAFLRSTAKAADAEALDGHDSSAFAERLFAVVESDGTVLAHRGLATTSGVRTGTGFYRLTFERDMRLCAAAGSTGSTSGGFLSARAVTIGKDFTLPGIENLNVRIQRWTGSDFVDEDARFDVQVVC